MFLNYEKSVALMRVGARFLELLQERLANRTQVGASTWYKDMAWGIRLFVEQEVPLFGGANAPNWLIVAEQFDLRGDFYATRLDLQVPMEHEKADEVDLIAAMNRVERFKRLVEKFALMAQVEQDDVSGMLNTEQKGITTGEAVKLSMQFMRDFWNYSYQMSYKNPHKKWLDAVSADLLAAVKALGEPMHAGDLGSGGSGTGPFPWSMPGA